MATNINISEKGKQFLADKNKDKSKPITGKDVAALLHNIHTHGDSIAHKLEFLNKKNKKKAEIEGSKIYYAEEDLLPVLKALGVPEPEWGESKSLEEWHKTRPTL